MTTVTAITIAKFLQIILDNIMRRVFIMKNVKIKRHGIAFMLE